MSNPQTNIILDSTMLMLVNFDFFQYITTFTGNCWWTLLVFRVRCCWTCVV